MSTESTTKKSLMTIGALALLFGVFWIFCRIEIYGANPVSFIIDCAIFLFIYGLCLFNIPLIIPFLCLVAVCVGRGYMLSVSAGATEEDFFIPLTYFFALAFFIEQLYYARGKGDTVFAMILSYALRILPFVCVGGIVYIFDDRIKFYYLFIFNMAMAVIVSLIYLIIAFVNTDDKKGKKGKKKQPENNFGQMKLSFGFAIVPVLASCLFLILNRTNTQNIITVLPVLWLLNIVLLYINKHALVCAFVERVSEKANSFFSK